MTILEEKTNVQKISTITINEIYQPLGDEEKIKRKYVDRIGLPKKSKILLGSFDYLVTEMEIFDGDHSCDLCDTDSKSKRIAVVKNLETGEVFRGAPDCMKYHFGFIFEDYEKSSQNLRILLEDMLNILGTSHNSLDAALSYVLANFENLVSFESRSNKEVKNSLIKIEGKDTKDLEHESENIKKITLWLKLQKLNSSDPQIFKSIWLALKYHPLRKNIGGDRWFFVDKINKDLSSVTLEELFDLSKLLKEVKGKNVKPKTPINPWAYETEESYLIVLRKEFQLEVDSQTRPRETYGPNKDANYLGTFHNRLNSLPDIVSIAVPFPIKTGLENFQLPNFDILQRYTNGKAEYLISSQIRTVDIGKGHRREEENKVSYIRLAIWVPDSYFQSYPLWFKYGRNNLESLDI